MEETARVKIGVLGAGGLGKAAARIIGMKEELLLRAVCDSKGFVTSSEGVDPELIAAAGADLVAGVRAQLAEATQAPAVDRVGPGQGGRGVRVLSDPSTPPPSAGSLGMSPHTRRGVVPSERSESRDDGGGARGLHVEARHCDDPLGALAALEDVEALLVMLPNLPNEFIPSVVARLVRQRRGLVLVDVLKRTRAVELMLALDDLVRASQSVVLTGCGATPGLLAAAAVLAAQSFIQVERVDIWWGVGIANWDAYKATIREDIAHLPGFDVERAKALSDAEIDGLLDRTHGVLELRHMEHADDVLLQRAGVVETRGQVEVGGVMDTRHPKKPVSTTMTLTGLTFEGKRSSHTFTLGDETTMAANVIGPALGYLKRGLWLKAHGIYGVFGSTEFLPMVVR